MRPSLRPMTISLLLALISIGACGLNGDRPEASPAENQPAQKESKMTKLSEAILSLDLSAADMARAQGPAAVPELTPFLTHENTAVKTTAVIALGEIAHPDAYNALMQAAQDPESVVAATAVDNLGRHAAAIGTGPLLKLLPAVGSDEARAQLILLLGTLVQDQEAETLKSFCDNRAGDETGRACMAVQARLGVEEARAAFSQYLVKSHDLVSFEMAGYIGQKWLLPYLGQLLGNMENVESLGDPPPGFPTMLRVCDKAVVLIAEISGRQFSFPTDRHANYDQRQLDEAAQAAGMAP